MPEKLDILLAPIEPHQLEWRFQSRTKTGKTIVVPYLTNRTVMERFDAQFGWSSWENHFHEVNGGFVCTITVTLEDGRSVTKSDAAGRTDIEPVKGGCSDAMKRCAVQFGLGRDLYKYPKVMIETTEEKFIPSWAYGLLDSLVLKVNRGDVVKDMIVLKQDHVGKV